MHVSVSLAFVIFFHMLFRVVLHGEPIISYSQSFSRGGSFAQMLAADALTDFKQDTTHSASVDAFEKGNGKSTPVKFTLDQNVRASSSPDNNNFFRDAGEFSLSEVILYEVHPAIAVSDGEYF